MFGCSKRRTRRGSIVTLPSKVCGDLLATPGDICHSGFFPLVPSSALIIYPATPCQHQVFFATFFNFSLTPFPTISTMFFIGNTTPIQVRIYTPSTCTVLTCCYILLMAIHEVALLGSLSIWTYNRYLSVLLGMFAPKVMGATSPYLSPPLLMCVLEAPASSIHFQTSSLLLPC